MPLLPYCVFLPDSVELPATGVHGCRVHTLRSADLCAIYSELEPAEIAGDRLQRAALDFHEVVHALFARRGVIPFRFPTWLTEDELRAHLGKESARYSSFLHEYAEDVQMEVLLSPVEVPQINAATGTEYMQRLTHQASQLRADALAVQHSVTNGVREWRTQLTRDRVRLFALVQRRHIDDFRDSVANAPYPGNIRLQVSGPWPAMEFLADSPEGNTKGTEAHTEVTKKD